MDVVHPRCTGVDVSKRDAKVCVRVAGGGRAGTCSTVTTWGSVTKQVLALREHLIAEQVTLVVMEATGDYWKPFFYLLEDGPFQVLLVNARHVKNLPGRKTDVSDAAWLIRSFLDDLERRGLGTITVADALAFARRRPDTDRRWHAQRLQVIAGLARYVHTLDPAAAELVPAGLIRARVTRRHPYLYSDQQIHALLAAAAALSPPPLAATMTTLIGLLAVSGMRGGEAIALDVGDPDADRALLTVTGKHGKRRLVPLHPSAVTALTGYLGGRGGTGRCWSGCAGAGSTPPPRELSSRPWCALAPWSHGRHAVARDC